MDSERAQLGFRHAPGLIVAITAGTSTITASCGASSICTPVVTAPKTLTSIAIHPVEAQESVGTATNFTSGTFTSSATVQVQADFTDALTSLTVKPTSSRIAAGTPIRLAGAGHLRRWNCA